MAKNLSRPPLRAPTALATAAAAALLFAMVAPPASAQDYYAYDGTVFSTPINVFPIDVTVPVLDLGGNTLYVGNGSNGGDGSFSALAGASLTAAQLSIAGGGLGTNGSFTATGAGARVDLTGNFNRLQVGNWGTGTLLVSGGALVDASGNLAACSTAGAACNNWIGNGAGSTAAVTVSGAGSELRTLGFLGVGHASVFTQAANGLEFGTPGGSTHATVNVLAGGVLRSQRTNIGEGPSGGAPLGSETSFANVVIDGAGSQWVVSRSIVDNSNARINLATHANATATMAIRNGGKLQIDGAGSAGPFDEVQIGVSGTATLTVTGGGSKLETVSSINPCINVGASSATGHGTLNILNGGAASSLYMNVGRRGGRGDLLVGGAGSQLTLTGIGVAVANTDALGGPAFLTIGRDGGTGQATISNGGRLLITDGDAGRTNGSSPGLAIGRDAGGTGSLTITGPGSTVEIVSTSLGLAAGQPDNFNPFVAVGYDNPATSTGTLRVENGGKLILAGNAVSTVTDSRTTGLNIGGRNVSAGNGDATVTGAGSEIRLQGYDAYIGVGRTAGSTGRFDVLDQAQVFSTSMAVGVNAPGTVNIDNALIALSGHRTNTDPAVGAGATIGRGVGGVGVLNMDHGAHLTITPMVLTSGMGVGGDQFAGGGTGTVTLAGGSSIVIGGLLAGNGLSVGRSGTGTVALSGASFIDVGTLGTADFGREPGGIGHLSLASGSTLRANEIAIGGRSDAVAGGAATATVTGLNSLLRAEGASGFISVGRGGTGALQVTDQALLAGISLNVGRAASGVGTMTVDNASLAMAGQQTSGSNPIGATVTVGNRGGSGTLNVVNGSQVTISNAGNQGVRLNVGGTSLSPTGTGHLNVVGSTVTMSAPGRVSRATIGYDGTGTASFSAGSRLDNAAGDVIIASQPGSIGQLTLNSGSVLNVSYVGVGSRPASVDGGSGSLVVNDSTVNTTTLEIGSHAKLGGNGGVINGQIISRGSIAPGNSPGRLVVNGGVDMTNGSKLELDIQSDGAGGFQIDELVLTRGSTYNFAAVTVTFNFLGNTNPQAFADAGKLDLDNFLRVRDGTVDAPLSSDFAAGNSWQGLFSQASFDATSTAYNISNLNLRNDGSGSFGFTATPVPEPSTWLLMALGLAAVAGRARRRQPAAVS